MRKILASTALVMFAATRAMGQAAPLIDDEFALRGIGPLKVVIDVPPTARGAQLYPSQLRTQVELRLRQAGVLVASAETVGVPFLSVLVNVTDPAATVQAYSVRVSLHQGVRLIRPPNTIVEGSTWQSAEAVGYAAPDRIAAFVRQALGNAVDEYINQWLAANPRR